MYDTWQMGGQWCDIDKQWGQQWRTARTTNGGDDEEWGEGCNTMAWPHPCYKYKMVGLVCFIFIFIFHSRPYIFKVLTISQLSEGGFDCIYNGVMSKYSGMQVVINITAPTIITGEFFNGIVRNWCWSVIANLCSGCGQYLFNKNSTSFNCVWTVTRPNLTTASTYLLGFCWMLYTHSIRNTTPRIVYSLLMLCNTNIDGWYWQRGYKGNLMIKHNTQILARGIQNILDKYNTAEECISCKGDPKRKLLGLPKQRGTT